MLGFKEAKKLNEPEQSCWKHNRRRTVSG